MAILPTTSAESQQGGDFVVSANNFTFDQLAEIYNQARVDYIVPMPMNGKRMAEYVRNYDVSLVGSCVAFNSDQLETGIAMLGLRDVRGWITRLGVLPDRRGHRIGNFLMDNLINYAAKQGAKRMQLEVIVGNAPAHRLFTRIGFQELRELLVVRRAPGKVQIPSPLPDAVITDIAESDIPALLARRSGTYSWLDETASLLNAGNLRGFQITLAGGQQTWVAFQRLPFQLTHFAFGDFVSQDALTALLHRIHSEYPLQDTKIENLPTGAPEWESLKQLGYIEAFRRTEMFMPLT